MGRVKIATITKEDIDFIKDNINKMTNREISDTLNVSIEKLRNNIKLLNIERDKNSANYFYGVDTDERVQFLKENIGKISLAKIIRTLRISKSAFDYILKTHGINYERYERIKKVEKEESEFFEHDKHGEWYFVNKEY
jgi:DNA-binding Lrp family transcriptional regulator